MDPLGDSQGAVREYRERERGDGALYTVHIPMLPLYKAEALVQSWSGAYMTKESS